MPFKINGPALTTLALAVNFLILLIVLLAAGRIDRLVGAKALGAFSKLVMVLLAALAVSFIRDGIARAVIEVLERGRAAH